MEAMRLTSLSRDVISASKDVLALRDRLKMSRVHAGAVATEVINLKTVRNRPDVHLVSDDMSALNSPLVIELAVAQV